MAADAPSETLEYTPTWVVATVCSVIIIISLTAERSLHCLGKARPLNQLYHFLFLIILLKKKQDALNRALLKLKEELMLLGFISLLLTVFQSLISNICIPKSVSSYMLPCKVEKSTSVQEIYHGMGFYYRHRWNKRRLLSSGSSSGFCLSKGKVPLLSLEALHQLHIFIFVLAVVHVVFSASTMIRKWKHWENAIQAEIVTEEIQKKNESEIEKNEKEHNDKEYDDKKHEPIEQDVQTHNHHHEFVMERTLGFWQQLVVVSWMISFFKQFYSSVSKSDYRALRAGFVMRHSSNKAYDFHKYMMRALEDDFKKVVGISWYLWLFVVIFLLMNVHVMYFIMLLVAGPVSSCFNPCLAMDTAYDATPALASNPYLASAIDLIPAEGLSASKPIVVNAGWHTYFWLSFLPLILLLVVGAKLDHIITKLALELQEKPRGPKGETQHVKLSNEHFWFKKPGIVLYLIQFILFQNSFEIAFFFWIWSTYGFHSCIMEGLGYLIPRLVIGVIIQVLCSYSTLPLYAIVTQMGDGFKESIFNATVQHTLHDWATQVKEKRKHQYGFLSFLNFHQKDAKNNNEIQMQTLASRAAEASHGIQQSASLQEIVVEDLHAV
ncbi:hypothetical protein C4D60_Mb03t15540 [Musa balbisiana]|uniref:MLO-like protein n=1 Tax=Musa balbisiana TaxID=52838 RepID=A0A4S8JA74_MUSBA|nr:hypothetical protein C4D60_Mb03t15540 [Musa balbisiana]